LKYQAGSVLNESVVFAFNALAQFSSDQSKTVTYMQVKFHLVI